MKIDFISDGSRQKNPSTAPATEKDSRLENPLKSGEMWVFQRCKNEKSDGSDGFWVGWQKTDPADPVREKEGVCRRCDRLCGDEKQEWRMLIARGTKGQREGFFGEMLKIGSEQLSLTLL